MDVQHCPIYHFWESLLGTCVHCFVICSQADNRENDRSCRQKCADYLDFISTTLPNPSTTAIISDVDDKDGNTSIIVITTVCICILLLVIGMVLLYQCVFKKKKLLYTIVFQKGDNASIKSINGIEHPPLQHDSNPITQDTQPPSSVHPVEESMFHGV